MGKADSGKAYTLTYNSFNKYTPLCSAKHNMSSNNNAKLIISIEITVKIQTLQYNFLSHLTLLSKNFCFLNQC